MVCSEGVHTSQSTSSGVQGGSIPGALTRVDRDSPGGIPVSQDIATVIS